jgi:PAS domain S-box-containing protein
MLEQMKERIHQFRQAEEQLREREEQYRSIFEATTDGLIIVDLDGCVVQANPAACKMYGYSYEEFIGLRGTEITVPDSQHLLTEALQTIKLGEQLEAPIHSNGLRKDGTTFLSEGYGTPFMYKGKQQILAFVRDVTEQVKTEQELREREEQYRSVFEATYDG